VPAARAFDEYLRGFEFRPLTTPVVANATGRPYPTDEPSATIRTFLVKQICEPVRWVQTLAYVARAGVTQYRELGHGAVLTKLQQQQAT
jgi:malonyl CoA-acyl carrier protein transacylase